MQRSLLKRLSSVLIASTAAAALFLGGCEGDQGDPGRDAVSPAQTPVNVSGLTAEQQSNLEFQGTVTGVTISSPPVVRFRITDSNGAPIIGLNQRNTSNQLTNLGFSIAKLVPSANGSPSRWVNYIVTTVPTGTTTTVSGSRPTRDREGTLVDNGDGSYVYTFARDITLAANQAAALTDSGDIRKADLGDLSYNANLTHRLVIEFGGDIANTSPTLAFENPLNIVFDFIPATGAAVTAANTQREIVTIQQCNSCHGELLITGTAQFPHPAATDTRYCVICHTSQRAFGRPISTAAATAPSFSGNTWVTDEGGGEVEVIGEFMTLVHKIHMGSQLTETGYNYAGIEFNDLTNPANPSLCRRCHDDAAAPQGQNWHTMPSRKACGSCHDNVHFATGVGHDGNLVQTSDVACTGCHNSTSIQQNHQVSSLSTTNQTTPAGLTNFFYEIASANVDPATNNLAIRFRIQQSTDTATATRTNVVFTGTGVSGFTGTPAFLLAYTLPQDGIAVPADYNNLGKVAAQPDSISIANLLTPANAGTLGSISGPDADGYYTATVLSSRAFPAGAIMRAVVMQGTFTQVRTAPLTNIGRPAVSVVTPVTGDAVRRRVVDSAKCDRCHERLEFHGGSRVYEIQVCVTCHNPNFTSSGRTTTDAKLSVFNFTPIQQEILVGWDPAFNRATPNYALLFPETSNNLKDMIHGIHAGGERTTPFRDVRNGPGTGITLINAADIDFPNLLQNCEVCHVTSSGTNQQTYRADLPDNVLPTTYVTLNATTPVTIASVTASRNTVPNPTDLVVAPITGACISCHDTPVAKAHMQANGALLGPGLNGPTYTDLGVARSQLDALGPPNFGEQCVLCHGAGRIADVVVVHER